PTTLLARQHYRSFEERFRGFPLKIAQASRLVGGKELGDVKAGLKSGEIDIVVGTHALLGKAIEFERLGLLIIDEEQHFGVTHKERLKQLKEDVHVLTLSATPIPRTLQLALSGVRELSLITTPPVDRLAVRTYVSPFDPIILRDALRRERFRGGQTFYVVPHIKDLDEVSEFLAEAVPELKIARAHGQLPPSEIEDIMTAFYEGNYDILLSTPIVESGLDVPNANTMIVHRADMFGLAQLYQLRGRVGRSKTRAYAYFTTPPGKRLTDTAEKRLKVLASLDQLGAGFSLASHDLDIRGGGNLLGEEQSGHIREVGFELYQSMLEETITALKGGSGDGDTDQWSPQIAVGVPTLIPEAYVADLQLRLGLYRRLSSLETRADIDDFASELADRFGPVPDEVNGLLDVMEIKGLCRQAGVEKIDAGPKGAVFTFRQGDLADPDAVLRFIQKAGASAKLQPDNKLVYKAGWDEAAKRLKGVRRVLSDMIGSEASAGKTEAAAT
ncbi:MAG: TRCF domain-containing protein, partial [Pseudomonadota bacterium]